ncbi:hypothetical protein [Pararhizobium sp. DWP1-1-3]|uniref:hypothetical protein n=1 Tax=Pararhizobium sp. DWP1-1-3 TaxID=2804652 RepID=UPI003CE6A224
MSENPSVNRSLKDKSMDHIDHALGRPIFPLQESYRNYFATDANGAQARSFSASLNWKKTGQRDDMAFFSVTDLGRHTLVDHLKTLEKPWKAFVVSFDGYTKIVPAQSRSAAKYSWWLEISDCWNDLRFIDFAKHARVRTV